MTTLTTALRDLSTKFQQTQDATSETALRGVRLELATTWANADPSNHQRMAEGELLGAHSLLRASGLQDFGLTTGEIDAVRSWLPTLHEQWPSSASLGHWLACSLFLSAYELGLPPRFSEIPTWLRNVYLQHTFEAPRILLNAGASADYAAHLEAALGELEHASCGQQAEEAIASTLNVVQAYFNDSNLKGLMKHRAWLIERTLSRRGHRLDHSFPERREPRLRPRVGILAHSFQPQTEGYFALSHLEGLDRKAFDIRLYAIDVAENPVLGACRNLADALTALPEGLPLRAQTIRNDDLDLLLILTNVGAVTNHIALLAAHRLARTQVASMSTPLTTGFTHVRHFLSAEYNESPGAQDHYSERLWTSAGSLNRYAFSKESPQNAQPTRSSLSIADDAVVYFSAANYFKIIPELSQLWARILHEVPSSRLVLLPFNRNWSSDYPSRAFIRRLEYDFEAAGVSPSRVSVQTPVPTRGDVAALMRLADVYLDGYPFAGACSLLDPLAVALPTVVREGSMARSRHGGAILRMFGLDELIAHDETEYLRIAVELGRNAERRAQLRGRVEHRLENGNPVLDSVSFGQALTPIFHQMIACGAQEDKARDRSDAGVSSLAKLSTRLADQHLRSLTDTELVRTVILPSFEPSADKVRHLVDVGACYGEMSQIFLERGWTADLFEPDPACRAIIQTRLASHSDRMRLHPVAVSDRNLDKIRFFKATTNGLSGLGPSPYGPTKEILEVPVVRLADYLLRMAVDQVDFLKVDTEGQDLHVLASHDFATLCPRYLLIEVNTEFPDQSLDRIRATVVDMRDKGYRAIILRYEDDGTFKQGIWDHYWLRDILTLETLPSSPQPFFANIVFFRAGDLEFVERLSERIERALKLAA